MLNYISKNYLRILCKEPDQELILGVLLNQDLILKFHKLYD